MSASPSMATDMHEDGAPSHAAVEPPAVFQPASDVETSSSPAPIAASAVTANNNNNNKNHLNHHEDAPAKHGFRMEIQLPTKHKHHRKRKRHPSGQPTALSVLDSPPSDTTNNDKQGEPNQQLQPQQQQQQQQQQQEHSNQSSTGGRERAAGSAAVPLDPGGAGVEAPANNTNDVPQKHLQHSLHQINGVKPTVTPTPPTEVARTLTNKAQVPPNGRHMMVVEEIPKSLSTKTSTTATKPKSPPTAPPPPLKQPDGWRVKLYRLNADGSWDDCGTGRIMCLYKNGPEPPPPLPPNKPPANDNGNGNSNSNNIAPSQTLDATIYQALKEPTLCMHSEVTQNANGSQSSPSILLRTRILLRDVYQRQGDNIITWCEPYLEEGSPVQGVDLALSFQDNAGCLDVWRQITQIQSKAADLFRRNGVNDRRFNNSNSNSNNNESNMTMQGPNASTRGNSHGEKSNAESGQEMDSVHDMAHAAAAAHHADLQRQQEQEMWANVASETTQQHHHDRHNALVDRNHDHSFDDAIGVMIPMYHQGNGPQHVVAPQLPQLPHPPAFSNLEEIANIVATTQHMQQREALAMYISQNDCSYLKSLLSLFVTAESRRDFRALATLAACVKTILLLNDTSIIELVVTDEHVFEDICATLEYDPELREKANHRWFLREHLKFRTVVWMEDDELVSAIHRSFRAQFVRDTLLRPTMDENCLSTLSSLQTFTHADVVKGVTMSATESSEKEQLLKGSYLAKVIQILGVELEAISRIEWDELENLPIGSSLPNERHGETNDAPDAAMNEEDSEPVSTPWRQHLAPQDDSLPSRRIRRNGCISFLKELFNLVRTSLDQGDKEDFFVVLVSMEVELSDDSGTSSTSGSTEGSVPDQGEQEIGFKSVNLLGLLSKVLADPHIDLSEKSSALEIVSAIVMHDPSLIRRKYLESYVSWKELKDKGQYYEHMGPVRPNPNEKREIIFQTPSSDLLSSLLFLLAVEEDPGILLQATEIMKITLDLDMLGDQGPMGGFTDEMEGIGPGVGHMAHHEHHIAHTNALANAEQNQFLSMFYDHYMQWFVAAFQYKILYPLRRIPDHVLQDPTSSPLFQRMIDMVGRGRSNEEPMLKMVPPSANRISFSIELLSFFVRVHLYRMKSYLLRTRVIGTLFKLLKTPKASRNTANNRCVQLAVLRFLRAVLSVNDEFYNRHIIQHDLFTPVFETFRANPVGDNLVASAVVEICDFIHHEKIKSLIEHIVTKHLMVTNDADGLSLEDVSKPYVNTFTVLRMAYENSLKDDGAAMSNSLDASAELGDPGGRKNHVVLNEKAREDQRKFHEVDQEESYFDSDDDEGPSVSTRVPSAVDEVEALHELPPRKFSLNQAALLNNGSLFVDKLATEATAADTDMEMGSRST